MIKIYKKHRNYKWLLDNFVDSMNKMFENYLEIPTKLKHSKSEAKLMNSDIYLFYGNTPGKNWNTLKDIAIREKQKLENT